MPPPPYIDDGSHDLLQEVIAMEELSQAPKKESKPRRTVDLDPEDELLILASPSRKDEHASYEAPLVEKIQPPPPPPPLVPPVVAPAPSTPAPPTLTSKNSHTSLKISKQEPRPKVTDKSEKGKEKAASRAPSVAPSNSSFTATPVKRKTPPTGSSFTPVNEG